MGVSPRLLLPLPSQRARPGHRVRNLPCPLPALRGLAHLRHSCRDQAVCV